MSAVKLDDPQLQDELTKALAALGGARDQDKKPVRISFGGTGDRRVRLGYVVETPVWKTSYRLVLAPRAGGPTRTDGRPAADGQLQGWAIVENQTDNDWTDVQLKLVSGRPISFVEDLYQPLYVPRPTVVPELFASLRPQTYGGGDERWTAGASADAPRRPRRRPAGRRRPASSGNAAAPAADGGPPQAMLDEMAKAGNVGRPEAAAVPAPPMDPTASSARWRRPTASASCSSTRSAACRCPGSGRP